MNQTNNSESGQRNILLTIAYDGTDFSGWQRQNRRVGAVHANTAVSHNNTVKANRTVQAEIEKALEKMHKHPVLLAGSGRTDAGVHAAGQAANFYTEIRNMEAARFVPALNRILPKDIRILEAVEVPYNFNARYDARSRTYRYYFIPDRPGLPWELRCAWQLWHKPSIPRLNALAALLHGELDCTALAPPEDKSVSRSRYIYGASFFIEGDKLVFEITANAFLWKMVRFAAGTLIRFEEENISPSRFKEIIDSGERSLAGPTAPPNGLFLWKVNFYG
ncbi:MAG: tRNA pseudouridine synthase A [Treponema sp.]|jgi:tRNA pseudouridine38-40 synthase|nr:tRNA pseudouridine synthase A [Treponema sp.]